MGFLQAVAHLVNSVMNFKQYQKQEKTSFILIVKKSSRLTKKYTLTKFYLSLA